MRNILFAALVAIMFPFAAIAEQTPASPLAGLWKVDLSTEPGTPYLKDMDLVLAQDGSVSGTFYNSVIEAGRWKNDRGRICVSFRTSDGIGPYHSAACLDGDKVLGQTWAEHRKFLFNWIATSAHPRP